MIYIKKYQIRVYLRDDGKAPFNEWIQGLDSSIRARMNARIARFEDGHFGDCKPVGDGIFEARFFFGAGYRIYFYISENEIVLLLMGGSKATQAKDIVKTQLFLTLYLEDLYANKK
jgi:putative addiction module killer protein